MVFLRVSGCFRRLLGVFDISGYFSGFVGILGRHWGVLEDQWRVFNVVFLVVICIMCFCGVLGCHLGCLRISE